MDRYMKYVVMKLGSTDEEVPILFPKHINHSDIDFSRSGPAGTPVGAGNVEIYSKDGKVKVSAYGKSVSLGVDSRPEDEGLIDRMVNPPSIFGD